MFTCTSIPPLPTLPGTSRTAIVSSQQRACNWSHCEQIEGLSEGVGFCLLPPSYPAKQSLPSPHWGRTLTCMVSDTWRNSPGCPRRRHPAACSSSSLCGCREGLFSEGISPFSTHRAFLIIWAPTLQQEHFNSASGVVTTQNCL